MFRITKAFENLSTFLYKIEGKVTENSLADWTRELNMLKTLPGRQVILDFSQVHFITPKAVEELVRNLNDNLFILNCGMEVRNRLHASGLAGRMLE